WFPRIIVLDRMPDQPPLLTRDRGVDNDTKAKTATLQRICLNPTRWNDVFKELVKYADAHPCSPRRPPTPLILAGWAYSNDTGKKARRLLVQDEVAAIPPWGGWSYRSSDEAKRRTFTRFRSAVNKAINPHEVDHIGFTTEPEQTT